MVIFCQSAYQHALQEHNDGFVDDSQMLEPPPTFAEKSRNAAIASAEALTSALVEAVNSDVSKVGG